MRMNLSGKLGSFIRDCPKEGGEGGSGTILSMRDTLGEEQFLLLKGQNFSMALAYQSVNFKLTQIDQ